MKELTAGEQRQVNAISKFFETIFLPTDWIEIRGWYDHGYEDHKFFGTEEAITRFGVKGGLFSDHARAADCAALMARNGLHTYFGLNPVSPDSFYAKTVTSQRYPSLNKPQNRRWFTARAQHMLCRRNYLFDLDPERPSGVCSTAEEKALALEQAQGLRKYLDYLGFPEPIFNDSGSGFHLLYQGEGRSVGPEAVIGLELTLRYLKTLFPLLDSGVYKGGQLCRVPYTPNGKGEHTTERPHRMAKVLSYPPEYTPVTVRQFIPLEWKADKLFAPARRRKSENSILRVDEESLADFIEEYSDWLVWDGEPHTKEGDQGTYFTLEVCPFKTEAHRGQFVGMGKSVIILYSDKVCFRCFSSDCSHYKFLDLLDLLDKESGERVDRSRFWSPAPEIDETGDLNVKWGIEGDWLAEPWEEPAPKALSWAQIVAQNSGRINPNYSFGAETVRCALRDSLSIEGVGRAF